MPFVLKLKASCIQKFYTSITCCDVRVVTQTSLVVYHFYDEKLHEIIDRVDDMEHLEKRNFHFLLNSSP